MAHKRYALSLQHQGVIVAPIAGALLLDEAAATAILDFGSASLPALLGASGGGFSKVSVIAGVDETGTPSIVVPGMAVGDELVAVLVLTTAIAIASVAKRANADFTVAAAALTIGANAANNALNQYVVFWNDFTP